MAIKKHFLCATLQLLYFFMKSLWCYLYLTTDLSDQ